jgi:hypothetical protein
MILNKMKYDQMMQHAAQLAGQEYKSLIPE